MLLRALCLSALPLFAAVRFDVPPNASREVFDFLEITVTSSPQANCFTTFALTGTLRTPDGKGHEVDGFCDSADGASHRIRFMATMPGPHTYQLRFDNGRERGTLTGRFDASVNPKRRGLLRTDPAHPFHFQWSGTGEHYFWNGMTTYALLGWRDDAYIEKIIDRYAQHKVNRLRVTLVGPRVADASRWYEPLKPSNDFQFLFGPWIAGDPANIENPKWDVKRFDPEFFRKAEKAIIHARGRDVIISVIFFLDGADRGADPFGKENMFGDDARRYYRYVNARLGAYSNVNWDVSNEWHLFRNAWWVEQMGSYLKSIDPYKHLISVHGRGDFPWMISQWPDYALFQIWDENGGYEQMLKRRQAQLATGHPFPQINEEYGYEDTYPVKWGGNRRPPSRNADSRRRTAWDITMAGCYQTGGEKASRNGDGQAPATPGGWINGGFDDSMTMLAGYQKMVEFFESFEYWKLEPVTRQGPARVMMQPGGARFVVYLPEGGQDTIQLDAGRYRARAYDPVAGAWSNLGDAQGAWVTPGSPAGKDVAYLLERLP